MKNKLHSNLLIALFLLSALTATAQKTDFSGNWVLDRTKSSVVTDQPTMIKLRIMMKQDSVLTFRIYDRADGQEYPFNENLGLDGKECNIIIYDMPRKSKASLSDSDGSLAFETVTTFSTDSGPSDFKSKEIWKLDREKKILTIDFKNNMAGNETSGSWLFNKVDKL
jgi:hypothetical protein